MIESIELINWKTHKHTTLNFQNGVNVLVGVMGAGKSSVMDAISFALFGTFPALNHKRMNLENIISNKPELENETTVRLRFKTGKDIYTVTRKISRYGSASARLNKNEAYLQAQPARVTEEIESLLKVDYETFSRAIYAEQNRLAYFLELAKGDRKKQIDQMLGLDNFAKAEENTTSLINNVKSLITDEEQILTQIDVKEFEKQLEKLAVEKKTVENEQEYLDSTSKSLKARVDQSNKSLNELKTKYEKKKKLSQEIAELSSKAKTLKDEIAKIKVSGIEDKNVELELKKKSSESEELGVKLKELKKDEKLITKKIAELEAEIKSNENKVRERDRIQKEIKEKNPENLEKELKNASDKLQELMKNEASIKGRKSEVSEWLEELNKHISKCPVCERELDPNLRNKLISEKNLTVGGLEKELSYVEKNIKEFEKKLNELTESHNRFSIEKRRLEEYKDLEKLIDRARKEEKKENAKFEELVEKIDSSSKKFDELKEETNQLRRKLSLDKDIKDALETLDKKNLEIRHVDVDEKEIYQLQDVLKEDSEKLSEVTSKMNSNNKYLNSINSQIEEKAKQISSFNVMRERIEQRRKQVNNLNKFKSALIETEELLRNRLVTSINSLMQNIWSEVYPYTDYSGIRLNAKKDDYSLEANTGIDADGNRIWVDVDTIASGGERSIAALTMRIALSMVIVPNLKWLILDEPTHNVDESGIEKLIEVLSNSLPKVVEQIFIITHDNNLKNINSAKIYQLGRNKNKNESTLAIEL